MSKRKKHTFTLSEAAKKKLALNLPYFMIGLQRAERHNSRELRQLNLPRRT